MKKLCLFVLALAVLCSCAMQQRMINPTDSRQFNCKATYFGLMGVMWAHTAVTDCINRYQALGFVEAKQDEHGHWVPKDEKEYKSLIEKMKSEGRYYQ